MYEKYYDTTTYIEMVREFESISAEIGFVQINEGGGNTVQKNIDSWLTSVGAE